MIDLHSHILPGLDDGASSENEMLTMSKAAIENGITQITATPHHQNGTYLNEAETIKKAVEKANAILQKNQMDLTILPGQEVRIYGELLEDIDAKKILPLNESKYIFIEFPSNQVPRYAKQLLYDLQIKGYVAVIVHPERNKVLMEHPDKLFQFVQNGAITQVTAASILGKFGKNIQRFSQDLIEANLTHVVASDAHNTTSRGFYMYEAYEFTTNKYGVNMTERFQRNAELIIANEYVLLEPPQKVKPKSFIEKILKK
ncbi:tyrosine-protein phosphatase [Alkalicoccus daliensis]|uniref:Tyrosine-protein phosphatase n=1 Tax=Alkalicoccus daliensis TaxID=745820 RepID=A0A1H0GGS2_9BACI|nr:CpsB/CapC family capsule biosynthesis tyrosine phosphatase [Alkalicoccus daliensis]SDO06074.1 protein-tyrosine phosphatase [Alkalicoccus daliensis]